MKRTAIASAIALLALSACGTSDSTNDGAAAPSTAPAAITVKLTEFGFIMPASIPAGMTTLHVENVGGMPHFVEIQGVEGNKTNDDIGTILNDPAAAQPKWLHPVDVPSIGLLSSQTSTDVTMNFPEGRYALFCWMPDANGTPHAMLGMHQVFDAVAGDTTAEAPAVDIAITATDGAPVVPETIPEGPQTIGYSNGETKPSQVAVVRILIDAPVEVVKKKVDAWFGSLYDGAPPVEFLGGLTGIPASSTDVGTTTVNFVPGVYAFGGPGKDSPLVIREVGGGGYPSATASTEAACSDASTDLTLVASGIAFDQGCLAVPADTAFTIAFDNQDADVPHNVAIWPEDGKKALFTGDLVTGPSQITYDVDGLPAGTYVFRCDIHPTTMSGMLEVG